MFAYNMSQRICDHKQSKINLLPPPSYLLLRDIKCLFKDIAEQLRIFKKGQCFGPFYSVPGMAQFLQVKVLSRVFTAKCSELQATVSNDRRGGSGVAKPRNLRTETGYKAKRRVRLPLKPKPER